MRYTVSLLALALAACAPTTAPTTDVDIVSVDVARDQDDVTVRVVEWSTAPEQATVDVYRASPRPTSEAELVGDDVTDTALVFDGEANVRSYFTITTEDGDRETAALRVLPLEGGRNFRDLGGYKTEDGRSVKWGLVYRSGVLAGLTDTDYVFLKDLGIATIVDFRANQEREDEATDWKAGDVEIVTWDYDQPMSAEMGALFRKPGVTPADITAMMTQFYTQMIYDHAEKYAELFDRLITTDEPLAFHCSAGKDRTGLGAALVLSALGVPRDTVVEDYALSEKVVDFMAAFAPEDIDPDSPYAFFAQLPPELVRPLMRTDPAYIEAALATIEADFGSVDNYIRTHLGVTDEELELLRERLLD